MYIIGLTGGISSGKTTVANYFNQLFNIDIIDADLIARYVVRIGTPGLEAIAKYFGKKILLSNGNLNRSLLRKIIFFNHESKHWLNQLLHPMILEGIRLELEKAESLYVLLVLPLLVERSLQDMVDRILVIDVDEQVQVKRTIQRDNISEQEVRAIIFSQSDRKRRLSFADDVIKNNNESEKALSYKITALHKKYLTILKKQTPS
ncbi:dephospho-CoA kinase [Candidatus Photodesmus katoptron]|uniref:Dephospho-CoA kinase n=1 Tax=Candidatus Photodesmus katoptron Akat1 TaxID=1236703 RepID=S3DHF2_9GAMM|nr:dephospho-CoA kinase [Candidatus Photodesmus katoptron]EPE37852.1 dephospho-CoA kinase [Candidatus Photodesmus katoptron Akat1]KEY90429.1 dephospho-CoA kinase [Candidatus Photodesmus katoptron]